MKLNVKEKSKKRKIIRLKKKLNSLYFCIKNNEQIYGFGNYVHPSYVQMKKEFNEYSDKLKELQGYCYNFRFKI